MQRVGKRDGFRRGSLSARQTIEEHKERRIGKALIGDDSARELECRIADGDRWWNQELAAGPARYARWLRYRVPQRDAEGRLDRDHSCDDLHLSERGYAALVLSSATTMHAAHRLYERLGFTRLPDRDWSPAPHVSLVAYTLPL